uniref:DNA-repair protein XRCC3 n=1 Tax=Tetraselmis sp. GSL018 TaxID=582737 RepID=A0A061S6Q7_9CHLO|eukprot:CAMPEP_0177601944 /NCGR_PEP_ID=MMETSP0419_2-20121207/14573_1 /TAXON_ID=582737 /ORGANISM="Tetraselmis sp., Strain GSL018" /LENGTH=257 /DNA_ID=CAMNT_0019095331 /DNA_START=74 /DNA_END=847 /DNA_ORIENTATION=-
MSLQPVRASLLPKSHPKCSTGCVTLDSILRGGVSVGQVTEIFGEATSGKTQFCLKLLLTVQLPVSSGGLEGWGMLIFTEGKPPLRRLKSLANHAGEGSASAGAATTDRVLVESGVSSVEDLQACLRKLLAMLYKGCAPVKVLVVDSIANVVRDTARGGNASEMSDRTGNIFQVAALLKEIASRYGVAVVVTNQVVDVFEDGAAGPSGGQRWHPPLRASSGRRVAPALGLAWASCINTRIYLSRGWEGNSENRNFEVR